jgi:hypothetical protein
LCCQSGHRLRHLELLDTTRNLTDEALEAVSTWCSALKYLGIGGTFSSDAAARLRTSCPDMTLKLAFGGPTGNE